ncbi:hypothetical protein JB92DRAFT_2836809 [Gautieria morchelliformis]|nr:hypothetical protein JB92DRAFT_2836809 [Gautieria morchelliformis]
MSDAYHQHHPPGDTYTKEVHCVTRYSRYCGARQSLLNVHRIWKESPLVRDFDYWEFVYCAICFLPFIADPDNAPTAPPSVPFWLTECGHTLCNNHLHADQSCAACGAGAIQLVPLQRDMMPPMCDWFRSVPHSLDAIASAAKSQQETMASLIRFYKHKCNQQRATINKTKDVASENEALRSQIEQLRQEVAQLRMSAGETSNQHFDQRSYGPKRHDAVDQALSYQPGQTRNINAPSRLTLPPDHQQPVFPSGMNTGRHQHEENGDPPGSSRFGQYTYQPPATTFRTQPLRHQQQPHGHGRIQQEEEGRQQQDIAAAQDHHQHRQQQQQQQQRMPPPPTSSRTKASINGRKPFRPAGQIPPQSAQRTQLQMQAQSPAANPSAATPRQSRPQHAHQPRPFPMSVPTPTESRLVSQRPPDTHGNSGTVPTERRFIVPSTPSNRFFPPRSTATPRVSYSTANGGGNSTRTPFVPGAG